MKPAKRFLSMLLMLCMLLSLLPSNVFAANSNVLFTDVKETDWFYDAVGYVYKNGMMSGTGNNQFSPNVTTTRGMIVTILYRLEGSPAVSSASFDDVAAGEYYANGVYWAAANGIVSGYGNGQFGPNDPITREQMAAILYRYAQHKEYETAVSEDVSSFTDGASVSSYAVEPMNWAVGTGLLSGVGNNMINPTGNATRAEAATILTRYCKGFEVQLPGEDTTAEDYYTANAELIEIIKADESDDVLNETEVKELLDNRGFGENTAYYKYLINGSRVNETAITEGSGERYPMYQTVYLSEDEDIWIIYVINGSIFAYPISFGLESDLGVELIFSESDTLTSYDDATNQFFVTIPHASEMIVETVDRIDADTLSQLTIEKICHLTGATVPDSINETNDRSLLATAFSVDSLSVPETFAASYSSDDPFIVVSLGDSYSSGEGIEEFYGQNLPLSQKVQDFDWLAHRSTQSWPGQITVPSMNNVTLSSYKVPYGERSDQEIQWYFGAVSGAQTKNFDYNANDDDTKNGQQRKDYKKKDDGLFGTTYKDTEWLPNQLDIFNYIDDLNTVDYVTLTIGGNDVDFTGVITCCIEPTYLEGGNPVLEWKLNELWNDIDSTMDHIWKVYDKIHTIVPNASILVAGYPKLLEKNGKGTIFSKNEATLVNNKVSAFNEKIKQLVEESESELNTYFVNVETEFDKDGGHQAYSEKEWINPIKWTKQGEDLTDGFFGLGLPSAYSIHPNAEGAQAYARCVNAKIVEIEKEKEDDTSHISSEIHYYEFFNNTVGTWKEAQEFCESLGGHLATLTSQEENNYVYQQMINSGYYSAYFGLTDEDAESTWTWITGEPLTYQNWHAGEPNAENSNEDYAMFYYKYPDGTWNDGDFGAKTVGGDTTFICEWDTQEAYNAYLVQIKNT